MNPSRRARADPRIVREDDPEHDRLIARCRGAGGAGVNAGSPAVNRAPGFELEPAWHAPAPPPPA
ncbi:hypothetical protein [Actinomyces dentalis]|uniref:hypothetical protein n=1 Tax=Actinomyces dentalis TaxID=272548 RepID=UPI0028E92AC3|nr:hypothetical protein [Actinomyces dentalis]